MGQEWKSTMPPQRSTPLILQRAGKLRQQTTPAEKKLWVYLRLMREDGVRFRRQHAIGINIVDFSQRDAVLCAPRKKLIIELDGLPSVAAFGSAGIRCRENNLFRVKGILGHSLLE
jgi:Uncharacterized protein conserved in bacteria